TPDQARERDQRRACRAGAWRGARRRDCVRHARREAGLGDPLFPIEPAIAPTRRVNVHPNVSPAGLTRGSIFLRITFLRRRSIAGASPAMTDFRTSVPAHHRAAPAARPLARLTHA